MPKISIILSTYRSDRYLGMWLSNLVEQTSWPVAELVVVANAPSKYESDLLESLKTKWPSRVKLISVDRESLYKSWNRCIDLSEGDYLAIANVDDLRTVDGLMEQISVLDSFKDSIFCYAQFYINSNFGEKSGRLVDIKNEPLAEFTRGMLLGPFFVWRRTQTLAISYFDEQFLSGGDFDFAIRLALCGYGVRVESPVGYYLDAGIGLSTGSQLQPIERTVIELRYGIFDKIDYSYFQEALSYNVTSILYKGNFTSIPDILPDYKKFVSKRYKKLFLIGIVKYYWRRMLKIETIINFIKLKIKILNKPKSTI